MLRRYIGPALALAALVWVAPASAQSVEEFYSGKTLNCLVGYGPGGGYDTYARTICKHMVKHIPGNPDMVAQNMPGASSMRLATYLYKVAEPDGLSIGAVNAALLFEGLFKGEASNAEFSGPDFTMVGSAVSSASVLVAWKDAGFDTLSDLDGKELIVGASSPTGDTYLLPLAMKRVLGLDNMKLILGYPGTREAALALERGEITGRVWDMEGIKAARPDWLTDGKLAILAQLAPKKMPEVPEGVPLAKDLAKSDDDKRVLDAVFTTTVLARPYIAPPGVPEDRAKALQDAFMATMADPEFLAEMEGLNLTIAPISGPEMKQIVDEAYSLPDPLVARVREILLPEE